MVAYLTFFWHMLFHQSPASLGWGSEIQGQQKVASVKTLCSYLSETYLPDQLLLCLYPADSCWYCVCLFFRRMPRCPIFS